MAQIIGRFGGKVTRPGRAIHTGRVINASTNKRPERKGITLRPRRKPRLTR